MYIIKDRTAVVFFIFCYIKGKEYSKTMNISLKIFKNTLDFCIKIRIMMCIRKNYGRKFPLKKGVGRA